MGYKKDQWKAMICHISEKWKKQKKCEFGYPFTGKDFKDLKALASIYGVSGVQALWDTYLELKNDFNAKTGYSIYHFQRELPWLLDDPFWRSKRDRYESNLTDYKAILGFEDTNELFSLKTLQTSRV